MLSFASLKEFKIDVIQYEQYNCCSILREKLNKQDKHEQQKLANGQFLYESVLEQVASWGSPEQLMFVVGATKANDLESIRKIIPEHFLLVPGVGAQGGSLSEVTKYGKNDAVGLLINASRAIIFASSGANFAEDAAIAAKGYADEMKALLSQ